MLPEKQCLIKSVDWGGEGEAGNILSCYYGCQALFQNSHSMFLLWGVVYSLWGDVSVTVCQDLAWWE